MSLYEDRVITKIERRAEQGLAKYGVTMERPDVTRIGWLEHAQQEAMDLAIYLERLIEEERTRERIRAAGQIDVAQRQADRLSLGE